VAIAICSITEEYFEDNFASNIAFIRQLNLGAFLFPGEERHGERCA